MLRYVKCVSFTERFMVCPSLLCQQL